MQDQPRFGIDAPTLVLGFAIAAPICIGASFVPIFAPPLAWTLRIFGLIFAAEAIAMTLSSLYGKPATLRRMLTKLDLAGDETVLDVGCGRGMLLLEVARRLPHGHATGIDLWSRRDQSGNEAAATLANARAAGLEQRISVDSGDMRALPYPDASFDVVVSSLAIHNLPNAAGRARAIGEIARVLKPGGRVALLDFLHTGAYVRELRAHGLADAARSGPNLAMFPWTRIVHGRKSA